MPAVTMIAGPNGSGKSTLIANLAAAGVDFGTSLNADDIARRMGDDPAWTGRSPEEVSRAAQAVVRDGRRLALTDRRDHSFETVMSHVSHIEYLQAARALGFRVQVYFVATDHPLINIGRVRNRVVRGGHDVPEDRIVARYHRCLANLPAAVAVADGGSIFDNSNDDQPFRHLGDMEDGKLIRALGRKEGSLWGREVSPLLPR